MIQALNVYWFYLILRMLYFYIVKGTVSEVRLLQPIKVVLFWHCNEILKMI